MLSRYNSPVPNRICSPLSSTLVFNKGQVLFSFRIPSNILGSSLGTTGSMATLHRLWLQNWMGFKGGRECLESMIVADLTMMSSSLLNITQFPLYPLSTYTTYLPWQIITSFTFAICISSSSSRLQCSPNIFTLYSFSTFPFRILPNMSNSDFSILMYYFTIWITRIFSSTIYYTVYSLYYYLNFIKLPF